MYLFSIFFVPWEREEEGSCMFEQKKKDAVLFVSFFLLNTSYNFQIATPHFVSMLISDSFFFI